MIEQPDEPVSSPPLLAYGYLGFTAVVAGRVPETEDTRMRAYARARGWDFGVVFCETGRAGSAMAELIAEVERARAGVVVVVSMADLCATSESRESVLARLGRAGAVVRSIPALRARPAGGAV